MCFAALALLCVTGFTACENDDTSSGGLQLFYPTVVDIGPSMNFVSGTPTYKGPAPSAFAVAGVTLDDAAVETGCFSINAESGVAPIPETGNPTPRVYKLTPAGGGGGPGVFVLLL